jgi:hypothetical protein
MQLRGGGVALLKGRLGARPGEAAWLTSGKIVMFDEKDASIAELSGLPLG